MKNFLLCCLTVLVSFSISAQTNLFQPYTPTAKDAASFEQRVVPNLAAHFEVDAPADLAKALLKAPTQENASNTNGLLLTLPRPDGSSATFRVFRYQMITDELQAAFPEITTAYGWDVDAPHRKVFLDWTALGFSASIIGGEEGRWYVEPLYWKQQHLYQSYFTNDFPVREGRDGSCGFEPDPKLTAELDALGPPAKLVGDCELREYRLALACTGEYYNAVGGTDATVIAEMVKAINRVNEVFRADLAIQVTIINQPVASTSNIELLYDNPNNDPYTNESGSTMLDENQLVLDNIIGTNNYDLGHVFSTGGGGIASLGSPCSSSEKAQGVTGLPNPTGDPFYIDFVAHEMGHQFGGNHSFNSTELNCATRVATTAYEPGSGTTIQAYAGICGGTANVQLNSDPYYHAISIQEISAYMELGGGASCAMTASTSNGEPTIDAGSDYTIPVSTPFVLTATGSDPNGDALTYCWEQFDLGAVEPGSPTGSLTTGPLFRSFPPVPSESRYFPSLEDVVAGNNPEWEVLPMVARDMNFIVTLRDFGAAGYGCLVQDQMEITVEAGSFAVTAPNGGETWTGGAMETVSWSNAGAGGVANCPNVDIRLSTDGGKTFDQTLATVANTGSAMVSVPMVAETNARIMIFCSDNIFYDVGDANFTISANSFAVSGTTTSLVACGEATVGNYELTVSSLGGYTGTVMLSATGLPGGVSATFSTSSITLAANASTDETFTLSGTSGLAPGTYPFQVTATDGSITTMDDFELIVQAPLDAPTLLSPVSGGMTDASAANFAWSPVEGATGYTVFFCTSAPGTCTSQLTVTTTATSLSGLDLTPGIQNGESRSWTVVAINDDCSTQQTTAAPLSLINYSAAPPAATGSSLSTPDAGEQFCEGQQATEDSFTIEFENADLTGPATLSVVGPAGITLSLSSTTINDGGTATLSFSGEENLATGRYTITVTATAGGMTEDLRFYLDVEELLIDVTVPENGQQLQLFNSTSCSGGSLVTLDIQFDAYTGPGTVTEYQAIVTREDGAFFTLPVSPGQANSYNLCMNEGETWTYYVEALLDDNTSYKSCDRTFTGTFNPLPVEWLSFTAEAAGKTAQLNWSVIQDEAHEGFTVERSSDDQGEWQSIGYVERTGPDAEASYRYTDISVLEGNTYYYRLRQEDVDGQTDYSVIRTVTFGRGGSSISIVPNPTTDFVTIFSGEDAPEELTYLLYSPLGQAISEGKMIDGQAKANLSNLPSGVYQLVVTDGGEYRETRRVVKK